MTENFNIVSSLLILLTLTGVLKNLLTLTLERLTLIVKNMFRLLASR